MLANIEKWIALLDSETTIKIEIKSVPGSATPWRARIEELNHTLLDSHGDLFMAAHGNTVDQAVAGLDAMCNNDLQNMQRRADGQYN